MQRHAYCERLAHQIHTCFAEGIHPEPDVRHYIDSTLAHPTRRELETLLKDSNNCERDTLLELIFFPGRDIQVRLENFIEESHFQQDEAEVILGMLMRKEPVADLYYPEGGLPVCLAVPEHAAGQFIARLNIHKQIDSRVRGAIRQRLPVARQGLAKVMVRNARFTCQNEKAVFLEVFIRNTPSTPDDFLRHLEFVLHFLETSPADTPLKTSLAHLKKQYRKNIIKAKQFEKQRQNRNIETMILQGVRIPHLDPQDDRQKIAMLDTVSLALYGKTL